MTAFLLLACAGWRAEADPPPLSSVEQSGVWEESPERADRQWTGKELTVQGEVIEVGDDFKGAPFLRLEGSDPFNGPTVYVVPARPDVQGGDQVIVTGRCAGKPMVVLIEDARVH